MLLELFTVKSEGRKQRVGDSNRARAYWKVLVTVCSTVSAESINTTK